MEKQGCCGECAFEFYSFFHGMERVVIAFYLGGFPLQLFTEWSKEKARSVCVKWTVTPDPHVSIEREMCLWRGWHMLL